MNAYVYTSTLRQHLRFSRIMPWLVLGIVAAVMGSIWNRLAPGSTDIERYSSVSTILVYRIMALASAIFTTTIISQEVEQKTIVYLLTRPIPRWQLLLGRYLASVTAVAIVGVFAAAALSFAVFGGGGLSNALFWRDCTALLAGAFAYGALFLLISLLINRAMIICLLFAFGWESSVPQMPGNMFRLSIYSYLQGIAQHPRKQEGGISQALGFGDGLASLTPVGSFITLGILVVVLAAFCMWWFTTFEYVPREDAE